MARASAIDSFGETLGDSAVASAENASAAARLNAALLAHSAKLNSASRLWVGLSGGADSTALLLAVKDVFPEHDVRASHINHGVQAQARAWAEQCTVLCRRLQVPIDVAELEPPAEGNYPGGFEAWARRGRYQHWRSLLGGGDVLLLGHHAADQRETVVLKLLQGRFPIPMPLSRTLASERNMTKEANNAEAAYLLRPWIELPGALTREFLTAVGERWIDDPSNDSDRLLRNRVRHQLLPVLAGTGPNGPMRGGWNDAFDRCGALTRRMALRFESVVRQNAPLEFLEGVGELTRLPLSALDCPAAVHVWFNTTFNTRVDTGVNATGRPLRVKPLSRAQIAGAIASLKQQRAAGLGRADRQGLPLGNDLSLWLAESDLLLWREPRLEPLNVRLPRQGHLRIALDHGTLTVFGAPGSSLVVRPGTPGEFVRGRPLRESLRGAGVPRWARASYPIVCTLRSEEGGAPAGEPTCIPRYQAPPEALQPPQSARGGKFAASVTDTGPDSDMGSGPDSGVDERLEAYFETQAQ